MWSESSQALRNSWKNETPPTRECLEKLIIYHSYPAQEGGGAAAHQGENPALVEKRTLHWRKKILCWRTGEPRAGEREP